MPQSSLVILQSPRNCCKRSQLPSSTSSSFRISSMQSIYSHRWPLVALILLLTGCATTAEVRPYSAPSKASDIQKGVVFSLPKTVVELTIVYSQYERKVWVTD